MVLRREEPPEELVCLDRTSPMHTMINWEACYCVPRSEFEVAMLKMNVEVSNIEVMDLPDGQYKATIKVSCEPNQFTSEKVQSPLSAKAKLMLCGHCPGVWQHVPEPCP